MGYMWEVLLIKHEQNQSSVTEHQKEIILVEHLLAWLTFNSELKKYY